MEDKHTCTANISDHDALFAPASCVKPISHAAHQAADGATWTDPAARSPRPCPNCRTHRPMPGDQNITFPAIADVRAQLADIGAVLRLAADSDGQYALAELFEYLRAVAAIVVDRPDLAAIVKRIHLWASDD